MYAKYVFDYIKLRESWDQKDLQALPQGLGGTYELLMKIVDEALKRERPELQKLLKERLLPILSASAEPLSLTQVNFVCNHVQPPDDYWCGWRPEDQSAPYSYFNYTGSEIANFDLRTGEKLDRKLHHATDWKPIRDSEPYSMDDVSTLLKLLYNLFPARAISDGVSCYVPYHKSVVDWLVCEPGTKLDSKEYKVSLKWGHKLLGQATVPVVDRRSDIWYGMDTT